MHYGVKGMKWGVRHDPEREKRRVAKAQYKSENKRLRDISNNLYRDYNNRATNIYKQSNARKEAYKKAYKSGQITKDQYKKKTSLMSLIVDLKNLNLLIKN